MPVAPPPGDQGSANDTVTYPIDLMNGLAA
jgi:hypothetical protein